MIVILVVIHVPAKPDRRPRPTITRITVIGNNIRHRDGEVKSQEEEEMRQQGMSRHWKRIENGQSG